MSIKVKQIWKAFGEKQVLRDFSYTFEEGSTTCILGASGCGKTTLLSLLMGFENPDQGKIIGLEGKKISAVFQENRLCINLTPVVNVQLVCSKNTKKDTIINTLIMLGLQDSMNQPVRELSGGMQRRVAIARALCADYDVLLLDEAFKGLDVDTKEKTIDYVREKTKGKIVISVTHDLFEPELLGGDILKIEY